MARGSIVKRRGNYYVVYRDPATKKQKWKAAGDNKRKAEKMLSQIMAKIYTGEYMELKEATFPEFAREWLRVYAKPRVKASTFSSYETIIERYLIPFLGNRKLIQINTALIQSYVPQKLKEGLTAATVVRHLAPLKTILKHAVKWGYLTRNPAQDIERPRVERKEMDFLTPEEIRLFLREVHPKYYPLFLTAVLTGMRQGELLGLKWSDINWATKQIYIRRSLSRGKFIEPKSKHSVRAVAMSKRLAQTLKRYRLQSPPNEYDLVFANENGQPHDPINLVKRHFHPALRRASLRRIRFHDLRHTFASLLFYQGENIKYVQQQLGHSSTQVTLDRYGHLLPDYHNEAAERLDETVFSAAREGNFRKSVRKMLENRQNYGEDQLSCNEQTGSELEY